MNRAASALCAYVDCDRQLDRHRGVLIRLADMQSLISIYGLSGLAASLLWQSLSAIAGKARTAAVELIRTIEGAGAVARTWRS